MDGFCKLPCCQIPCYSGGGLNLQKLLQGMERAAIWRWETLLNKGTSAYTTLYCGALVEKTFFSNTQRGSLLEAQILYK